MTATDAPTLNILRWLADPPAERHLHFFAPELGWVAHSYAELADRAHDYAAALHDRALPPATVVAIVLPTGPELVAAICGVMLIGQTACVLPVLLPGQSPGAYAQQLQGIFAVGRPSAVIGPPAAAAALGSNAGPERWLLTEVERADRGARRPIEAGHYPLAQFTSGSTGQPRGVLVSTAALNANHASLSKRLGLTAADRFISWLPANHDMGLVGMLLGALHDARTGFFMSPQHFIRYPGEYLRAISAHRATVTALPGFGLEHLRRRVPDRVIDGLDLSCLRSVVLGGERVDARVLARFQARFGRCGLRNTALSPAYGSAEATLAVSLSAPDEAWRAVDHGGSMVVSCGRPVADAQVRIVDELGRTRPDGEVGEIVVSGPSINSHPLGADLPVSGRPAAHATGDAGFVRDGELFVLGRYGDGIKIRGAMVFPETLESELVAHGLDAGGTTVLLSSIDGPEVVFLFTTRQPDRDRIAAEVAQHALGVGHQARAADVTSGELTRTSSGKPRRRALWVQTRSEAFAARLRPLS